jgi:hypothetical protein
MAELFASLSFRLWLNINRRQSPKEYGSRPALTGSGAPAARPPGRSEQGKLPAAKEFRFAERDKHMSEEKRTFMQELDLWSEANVINPLLCNDDDADEYVGEERVEQIQRAIRQKVLESYRNGQSAGPRRAVAAVRH